MVERKASARRGGGRPGGRFVAPAAAIAIGLLIGVGIGIGVTIDVGGGKPGSARATVPPGIAAADRDGPEAADWSGTGARPLLPAPPEEDAPRVRYAVATADPGDRPIIAVVIDDIGMDKARSMRAIGLPGPLTMAMLPYAGGLDRQVAAARANGHEIIVHIPMEPHDATADPGPRFLAMAHDFRAFRQTLDWNFRRLGSYVGFSNHMGSRFTEDLPRMRRLMREARSRGLLFLDSMTTAASVGVQAAAEAGVPHARRHVFLDNERSAPEIWRRLAQLEETARRRGFAVGIGHPHDSTIDVLATWIPEARRRGFVLVPISAVVRRRTELAARRDLAQR